MKLRLESKKEKSVIDYREGKEVYTAAYFLEFVPEPYGGRRIAFSVPVSKKEYDQAVLYGVYTVSFHPYEDTTHSH